ncbi:sulfotransferase 1B1-like [Physella acuta]|uniref:sulfotransferase 1B1-like n=1 Tax=Physella acuta TaxID=109671 RepID=UPI0027DC348E|nr:sulfotransferase 1B1-like [Physella acuta]
METRCQEGGMDVVYFEDRGGAKLKLQVVDGRYFPAFPPDVIKNMRALKIRGDDVILVGYVKAGTHWVWEITRMLLANTTDVKLQEKDDCMIEDTAQYVLDALPSPRVLNTHVLFDQLPVEVLTQKPKIIYLTRNPKDTAVSLYHHNRKLWDYYFYDGKLEDYIHLFLEGKGENFASSFYVLLFQVTYGSWFDHIRSWGTVLKERPELDILEVNYEDLSEFDHSAFDHSAFDQQDPLKKIRQIASFLGVSPTEELVARIDSACSINSMRERKGGFYADSQGHSIMYRKGLVGDWRNEFTAEVNDLFDGVLKEKLVDLQNCGLHWRFQLDQ